MAGLSIIIASVPVALPLILRVTMAIGATVMATEYSALITHINALQDIATMQVLCSDKTGTITTGKMTVDVGHIVLNEEGLRDARAMLIDSPVHSEKVDKDLFLMFAALGSNRAKVNICHVGVYESESSLITGWPLFPFWF
jgi:P-type E1-E2 ATPase